MSRSRINIFTSSLACMPLWIEREVYLYHKVPSDQICVPYIQGDQSDSATVIVKQLRTISHNRRTLHCNGQYLIKVLYLNILVLFLGFGSPLAVTCFILFVRSSDRLCPTSPVSHSVGTGVPYHRIKALECEEHHWPLSELRISGVTPSLLHLSS